MHFTILNAYRKGEPYAVEMMSIGMTLGGVVAYLERTAAEAYVRMEEAALHDGITWTINYAFRDHNEQGRLYRKYVKLLAEWERGGRVGKRPASAAVPGFSTHQMGKSVDINRSRGDDLATPAPDSPVDKWLDANAHIYGFVRDVRDEPWHLTHLPEKAKALVA